MKIKICYKYYRSWVLVLTGVMIFVQSHGQTNAQRIDSLSALLRNYKSPCSTPCLRDSFKVNLFNDLAYFYSFKSPDTALSMARDGFDLATEINLPWGITDALTKMAYIERRKGNKDESMNLLKQAITICDSELTKSEDPKYLSRKATAIGELGLILNSIGEYSDALTYYTKALTIREKLGDTKNVGIVYGNFGMSYMQMGLYKESLEYYLKSLRIKEELHDTKTLMHTLGNIGNLYSMVKDYNKALEYDSLALENARINQDKLGIGISYNNLSEIYLNIGLYEKALNYGLKAKDAFDNYGARDKVPIALANIAEATFMLGRLDEAISIQHQALAILKQVKDRHGMSTAYLNIGQYYISLRQFDLAKQYLDSSMNLSKEYDFPDNLLTGYEVLTELDDSTKNYLEAYSHYRKAVMLKDSLLNEDKTNEMKVMSMNYEFEKKEAIAKAEQENQMLLAETERRRYISNAEHRRQVLEAEKQLEVAEADNRRILAENEKQKLSEEIIGQQLAAALEKKQVQQQLALANAEAQLQRQKAWRYSALGIAAFILLSLVSGFMLYRRSVRQKQKETFLSLQVSETEMKALRSQMNPHFIFNALQSIQTFLLGHKSDEANNYLLKFSKLMRAVLENSQHSEVPLREDIKALELYMQLESIRLTHPFTYAFHIDENLDVEETGIPPLILQPFVENAIWHGLQHKTGPGHIDIFLSKHDGALHATVQDNGVGREMSKNAAPPMLLKKESLGMKLTEERLKILNEIKKIKAQFKITDLFSNDNKPSGTRVELSLPLVS